MGLIENIRWSLQILYDNLYDMNFAVSEFYLFIYIPVGIVMIFFSFLSLMADILYEDCFFSSFR